MEQCVLCLRRDRPMTREHVFAHWLVIKLKAGKLVPSDAPPAAERIGRVVTTVCADCNAGWMSALEVSFRRILFGARRIGVLQEPDRVTLSRWFAKTAILLAHANGTTLVGASHRAQLVTGMPDDIEVFVARRRRPPQRLDFGANADSVSILVDDLVGHVARPGILTSRHGTRLWPLRSHLLRWETLPVTRPLPARALPARRSGRR
jgi:hypothetical protein